MNHFEVWHDDMEHRDGRQTSQLTVISRRTAHYITVCLTREILRESKIVSTSFIMCSE
jgi:hypothetical protein